MKIKVHCPCSARFEFEVEPVNGRMPVTINCPTCGADATELANAVIQQQSAAPASGLRISKSHSAPAAPNPAPVAAPVPAAEKRMTVAATARQRREADERHYRIFKILFLTATALGVAALGLWGWYAWFAREPKVVYSLPIPVRPIGSNRPVKPDEYYQLIGPGQLLSVKNKHANLFDITKQFQLWSTPLQTDTEAAAAKAAQDRKNAASGDTGAFLSEDDYNLSNPSVAVTTNDVWLAFRDRLLRLDRQTGARKEPSIMGRILGFESADDALMVVYISPNGQRTLARISLPGGVVQTADLYQPSALKPTTRILAQKGIVHTNLSQLPVTGSAGDDKFIAATAAITRNLKTEMQTNGNNIAPSRAPSALINEMASYAINHEEVPPFVLTGPNVVQFSAKLLEAKSITHEAVKPKGKSILDDGNVTASQGLDLAQEMINDSAREATGGVEIEDVSRYQVTLHRWFAEDAPDWTGEVVGPPNIYSLKSVDLLVAGQSVTAFDKHNKKLWEGKLTYAPRLVENRPPCLETKDALYFADPGVLTRFDLATGSVRWRIDSVGISSLQADERGNIYFSSTTAGPDHITHPHTVNVREKIHPLLFKVNAENGKVLWRLESVGADCFMSGKFLYATWVNRVQSALKLEEGPDTHYNLRLLDPANGNEIWEYHKVNRPVLKTEVQQNWILLQYEDGVAVLKFFSL